MELCLSSSNFGTIVEAKGGISREGERIVKACKAYGTL